MNIKLNENIFSKLSNFRFKLCGRDDCEPEDINKLKNVKLIGLYFGNTMSAECRAYTKALKDLYRSVNDGGKVFEIIFITNEDEDCIRDVLNIMPWYYIEQDESDLKELRDIFNAYCLPKFGLISSSGNILLSNISIDKVNKENFNKWIEKSENIYDMTQLRLQREIKHK